VRRAALCALTAVAVAGTSTAVVQAKTSLKLKADPKGALKFDKTRLRATPGQVTIRLTNPSSSGKPHAIEIEGKGKEKKSKVVGPGGKATVTITLKKGTYEFYCPVGNHKAAGMEGKLIVK
jgi:plastocyanin